MISLKTEPEMALFFLAVIRDPENELLIKRRRYNRSQ